MNYIALGIIVLTLLPIICGLLLGLLRGWRRSALRFGLVILALILAIALCGVVSSAILNMQVPGEEITLREFIVQMLADTLQGIDLGNLGSALAESVLKIIMFVLLFDAALFLTWAIVFPICKIFVKPYKDSEGNVKKRRLIGMGIGAVQGLVVGLVFCIMISGLAFQVGKLGNAVVYLNDLQGSTAKTSEDSTSSGDSGESSSQAGMEILDMFSEYTETSTGKFYNSFSTIFDAVSRVDLPESDRKITLSGTVDAVNGMAQMAHQVKQLQDVDFSNLFNFDGDKGDNVDLQKVNEVFEALDSINGDLSPEAKETIKDTLSAIGDSMDLPVDLDFGDVDFDKVEFAKEGEIIGQLVDYAKQDNPSQEDAKDVAEKVLDSNLIVPALQGSNFNAEDVLTEEQRETISDVLDELESDESKNIDPDKLQALRDLLGLGK